MSKAIETKDLARSIPDGSTIGLSGFGGMGQCDNILKGVRDEFLQTGHPNNLTVFHTAGQSDGKNGIEHLAEEGLIQRVIGGHWGLAPKMRQLIEDDKIEAYCFPQGQLTHLYRTIANGLPGQLSPIGIGTFVDPRLEGGKFNNKTKNKEDLVKNVTVDGQQFLYYKSIKLDYVFIRGTTADENGNIATNEEPLKLEILSAAQAAKASGGKVVVQVKYLAEKDSLHPKDIVIPGYLVDHIVVAQNAEEDHRQTPGTVFSPIFTGEIKTPASSYQPIPMSVRKVIGRRAVEELGDSSVINLGIGIPGDVIGPIINEQGLGSNLSLTVESGIIGGIPLGGNEFGVARNPEAIMEHEYMFDFYHGTGVDVTFMGAAEVDRSGNVNVSKFGKRTVGCGGFIDITQPAKKVVFCTTFTVGGLETSFSNGQLKIDREGTVRKFVDRVGQITYSGNYAAEHGQEVVYVTERAVFVLTKEGLELTEIAPGIDLERDILSQMDFKPIVKEDLKIMDERLFQS